MSTPILKHITRYASAGLLAALGGVLSFPILTRNLSVEDYGLLGLITSSIAVAAALGKLGIQHSIIRFFAQVENNPGSHWTSKQLYSTVFCALLFMATLASVLWLVTGTVVLPEYLESEKIPSLFALSAGIVFLRILGSGIINFLRAQQSSGVVSISQVLHKYLHLLLILLALYFEQLSTAAVIVFLLFAESVMVIYVARKLLPNASLSSKAVSTPLIKTLIVFGLPLMAYESLSLVLRLSDRYIIEALLGSNALGQYSASYNLTSYLDMIILSGMIQAIRPMYTEIWETSNKRATQVFLAKSFRLYVVIGIPLILAFSLVAPHLLLLLSGDKYQAGTIVIPFVALSFLLEGAVLFLGAGLHIGKNTRVFLKWALVAAVLNITLNILLVPYWGLIGAAIITIVSYLVFLVGTTRSSFKELPFEIDTKSLLLIPCLSLVIYFMIARIELPSELWLMIVNGLLSLVCFGGLLVLLDSEIRGFMFQTLGRFGLMGKKI